MHTAGIIVECNPFHKGHEYFINRIKEENSCGCIAAVMSGDFVQRGEPAVLTKEQRTKILLSQGVDLVLELPVRFALGNARSFARGAAAMLNSLPMVDTMVFGTESGNIDELNEFAKTSLELENTQEYKKALKENLKMGQTYAAASGAALSEAVKKNNSKEISAGFISTPNNLLGTEYIKALSCLSSGIKAKTIKRINMESPLTKDNREAEENTEAEENMETEESMSYYSASKVRELMCRDEKNIIPYAMPRKTLDIISSPKLYPITADDFSLLLYDKLLSIPKEGLADYEDITPFLSNSIKNNLPDFCSFSQYASLLQTKNYTLARIKRSLCHILLGIKKTGEPSLLYDSIPLRVLGMKKGSAFLLKNAKAPVITTGASINQYNKEHSHSLLAESIHASLLYRQAAMKKFNVSISDEYHAYPILL